MLIRHTYNITKEASQWFGQFEQKHVKAVKRVITNTVFRNVLLHARVVSYKDCAIHKNLKM